MKPEIMEIILYLIKSCILTIFYLYADMLARYNFIYFLIEYIFVIIKIFITSVYCYFKIIFFCLISIGYLFFPIVPIIFHFGLFLYFIDLIWNIYLLMFIYFLILFSLPYYIFFCMGKKLANLKVFFESKKTFCLVLIKFISLFLLSMSDFELTQMIICITSFLEIYRFFMDIKR